MSVLPGGGAGSAWRHPRKPVALAIRLSIFAVGGLTAYAVSQNLQCMTTISCTCTLLIQLYASNCHTPFTCKADFVVSLLQILAGLC